MQIATIRVVWSPPLDPAVWGYGPRIDPGGYVYQIIRDGVKLVGGSYGTHDADRVWARAFKIAHEKGFTHYVPFGTDDEPKEIVLA